MDRKVFTLEKLQVFAYYLFFISVFFSGRFNIGYLNTGKSIDLRLEDIILFFLLLLTLSRIFIANLKFKWSILEKVLFLWIIYKLFTVFFSFLYTPLYLGRFFYFLKELEFLLVILIFPTFVEKINIKKIYNIIIIAAVINSAYIIWQILTSNFEGLKHGYYGIAIIGEYNPLSSGLILAFFSLFFLLQRKNLLAIIFAIFTALTMSRASIIGLVMASTFTLKLMKMFILIFLSVILIILSFNIFQVKLLTITRVIDIEYALHSIKLRTTYDYSPIVNKILDLHFLLPLGKGCWGILDLPIEAHDIYLRILLEEGIIGFIFFIFLLYIIFKKAYISKIKLVSALLLLLIFSSLFQDAILNQKGLSLFTIAVNILQIYKYKRSFLNRFY